MAEDPRVTIRIPESDLQIVDALVDAEEFRDRSEVIRRALKEFLNSRAAGYLETWKQRQAILAEAANLQTIVRSTSAQDALERLNKK